MIQRNQNLARRAQEKLVQDKQKLREEYLENQIKLKHNILHLEKENANLKKLIQNYRGNQDLNQSHQTSSFISPVNKNRKQLQNSSLNISQELQTLDRLKQQTNSSWKLEQKKVISHFQSVISKLQHQFQASNQSQRNAQRQLQTAWTNAQKNQSDLQEQIRLLHQQNQELLASLLDAKKITSPTAFEISQSSVSESPKKKQQPAIKIFQPEEDDNSIQQELDDQSFSSPLGNSNANINSSSKKSTIKLFEEENFKLQLNETKRIHSDTIQSYEKQFKMLQKQKNDLQQQIKRMIKTFADKERVLEQSLQQVRANNNSLIDVANTRQKIIQKQITTMKEELESLQEQYDAREMKYIEDAQKYANDVEKYHKLLKNLQKQLDEQIGGKMFELIKQENKKLRVERKDQSDTISQLHSQVNKQNSKRVNRFLKQMSKINHETRQNQRQQDDKQILQQQYHSNVENSRIKMLQSILQNQNNISQMIKQSLTILNKRIRDQNKKDFQHLQQQQSQNTSQRVKQLQNKNYIQELKQNISQLKTQNNQLLKIKKKYGQLKTKNLFSENQLVQAKKNLITHIAALNSLQPAIGGSQQSPQAKQSKQKSVIYLQSICSKLEAQNGALLQAKIDMENLCKREIANLYVEIHKLEGSKVEAQDKINLLTQNLHHSFSQKMDVGGGGSGDVGQMEQQNEEKNDNQTYSQLLKQILGQITGINSRIAQLCQTDFQQPRIRSHPQTSPKNLSSSTPRLNAPRTSRTIHTISSHSKLNIPKNNQPKLNFNFKTQIQKIKQEFSKTYQRQLTILNNQNKQLQSHLTQYQAKSDAIQSYYSQIISRNNEQFQLLSFAKKELQIQSNDFLSSQTKRASLASTLTRIHRQFKFEGLESSTIQILRKQIATLQSRMIFEQQQFEREIEQMHNIHSQKVMNLSQRQSLLKFESQKLRRELELYEQLSQNRLRNNKEEVNKAKKELNSLRRICNQNQMHTNSHKQKAVDKVEKMQEFYMQKEQSLKKYYLEKINKLQQQLNAKNKLVHHVNNILRKERVQREQELQSQSDRLFDGLRGLSGQLAKMRTDNQNDDVDQYSFNKGGQFLGVSNGKGTKIAEKNWTIQKKALNAMIDKLKNQIEVMEDQFNSQRSRFKKEIVQLRRTLDDMNKRYQFELSTLRRADDVILNSSKRVAENNVVGALSPIHATMPNPPIGFDQKTYSSKNGNIHETSLDSMMKMIFDRDQNRSANENKLISTLQRTGGESSQSFGMPAVLTPRQFKESSDEDDAIDQGANAGKGKIVRQQFQPGSVQKINLKQLYGKSLSGSKRGNQFDEYSDSQNDGGVGGSNILQQLSQRILSSSFDQSDQDRKINKKRKKNKQGK